MGIFLWWWWGGLTVMSLRRHCWCFQSTHKIWTNNPRPLWGTEKWNCTLGHKQGPLLSSQCFDRAQIGIYLSAHRWFRTPDFTRPPWQSKQSLKVAGGRAASQEPRTTPWCNFAHEFRSNSNQLWRCTWSVCLGLTVLILNILSLNTNVIWCRTCTQPICRPMHLLCFTRQDIVEGEEQQKKSHQTG